MKRTPDYSRVLTREYAEKLMIAAGHAINSNAGRCYVIEDALCMTTTLCCAVVAQLKEIEILRSDLAHLERKISHGCTDAMCSVCDKS